MHAYATGKLPYVSDAEVMSSPTEMVRRLAMQILVELLSTLQQQHSGCFRSLALAVALLGVATLRTGGADGLCDKASDTEGGGVCGWRRSSFAFCPFAPRPVTTGTCAPGVCRWPCGRVGCFRCWS